MTADELKQGFLDSMLRIAERFGVPVVLLGVLIWLGREAAISLHSTLVQPVVKSHVEFLESTSETLHEIGRTQEKQADTLEEIARGQRDIGERLRTVRVVSPDESPRN